MIWKADGARNPTIRDLRDLFWDFGEFDIS